MKQIHSIAIATPTYNESKNIVTLIKKIEVVCRQFPAIIFTLLVIDDNSPDGTAAVVENHTKNISSTKSNLQIRVLKRKAKEGLGKAYVHGFSELLTEKFDYVLQMDADLSHNPAYIKDFVNAALKGHDFIVASRYIKGGDTPDWSWYRKLLSRGGNLYARMFLGSMITDYTGGYNMYSAPLLKHIISRPLVSSGYGFLIELKYRAVRQAVSPTQIPIVFHDRQHGISKIPKSTLLKNFILVPKIRWAKK